MTNKRTQWLYALALAVLFAFFVWLAFGCAMKGLDTSSDFDMPVRVEAGDDATIITLGRLSGGGIGCLLLSALLLWRAWRVARAALQRTICGIEQHATTKDAKKYIFVEGMESGSADEILGDAAERAIRRCLKKMKNG